MLNREKRLFSRLVIHENPEQQRNQQGENKIDTEQGRGGGLKQELGPRGSKQRRDGANGNENGRFSGTRA